MSVIDRHPNNELNRPTVLTPVNQVQGPATQLDDCILTSRDYSLLEVWLTRALESDQEVDPLLIALVRSKLRASRIVLSSDLDADRARGGSRVVYTLDGAAPKSELLAHWRPEAVGESILPITSILGMSLLGMRAPQRVPLVRSDGSLGGVWLDAVGPHPGRPPISRGASYTEDEPSGDRGALRPAGDKVLPFFRPGGGAKPVGQGGATGLDDEPDPGPSAA